VFWAGTVFAADVLIWMREGLTPFFGSAKGFLLEVSQIAAVPRY
jgi:hypothetical protein